MLDIETKYFSASDYDKFMIEILNGKKKEKELFDKSNSSGFIDKSDLDKKIATLAAKVKPKLEQD